MQNVTVTSCHSDKENAVLKEKVASLTSLVAGNKDRLEILEKENAAMKSARDKDKMVVENLKMRNQVRPLKMIFPLFYIFLFPKISAIKPKHIEYCTQLKKISSRKSSVTGNECLKYPVLT